MESSSVTLPHPLPNSLPHSPCLQCRKHNHFAQHTITHENIMTSCVVDITNRVIWLSVCSTDFLFGQVILAPIFYKISMAENQNSACTVTSSFLMSSFSRLASLFVLSPPFLRPAHVRTHLPSSRYLSRHNTYNSAPAATCLPKTCSSFI